MSIRTKILAAVVGLQLLVILSGVSLLVFGRPDPAAVPADIVTLLSRIQSDPGPKPETRPQWLRALAATEGVRTVLWLEESDDAYGTPRTVPLAPDAAPPPAGSLERASELFRQARREGRVQIPRVGELAMAFERSAPSPEDGRERRQGLYLEWSPRGEEARRAQIVYAVLLGGGLVVSVVGWWLLSRHVVRPLATLADAADKMAGGDAGARVPATGTADEIDRTARAFNRMAKEVSEYQGQLEDRVMQALARIQKAEQHLAIAQRLASTGKLASGIAHEINNPLGGMRNAVRALARGDLDEKKTAEYLALVQEGLARVEDTVKKVLTFTPRTVQPRAVDLADVARKAVGLARHRIERKGIALVEHLPAAGVATVFGDPNELQQVALNLILNSADAIPEPGARPGGAGRIEIEVSVEGDANVLRVADDGMGMTPEVQAQCFDLFFTTKEVGEGTGLGLAVVHNIVTNHGGRIELESAPGKGTSFRVLLPREPALEPAPAPKVPAPQG